MTKSSSEWTPGVGVGLIKLGEPIADYIKSGDLRPEETDDDEAPVSFEDAHQNLIVTADSAGLVEEIVCDKSLRYRGQEIIGLSEEEIISLVGRPDTVDDPQILYDGRQLTDWFYWQLGLAVVFESGRCWSATVEAPVPDDEP